MKIVDRTKKLIAHTVWLSEEDVCYIYGALHNISPSTLNHTGIHPVNAENLQYLHDQFETMRGMYK